MNCSEIRALVQAAKHLTAIMWATALVNQDKSYAPVPSVDQQQLCFAALAHGYALASQLPRGIGVAELVQASGATCIWVETAPQVGPILFQAEYEPDRALIILYRKTLEPLTELVRTLDLGPLMCGASPADVYMAHELYHHLAYRQSLAPFEKDSAGRRRPPGQVRGLHEIAAHAFAMRLLSLSLPPLVLDYLSLIPFDEATALVHLRQIVAQEV